MLLRLSKAFFFFLIIFSPLAFGTTEDWSYAIMEVSCAIGLTFFFFHVYKNKDPIYEIPGITPLSIFLVFILFQLIPLPPGMIELLSKQTFDIHQTTRQITGQDFWMPLTVNTKATLSEFFRYSTYVLFYVWTVQLLSRKGLIQTTVFAVTFFGGLLALSSILQFYLTDDMALWFRHIPTNAMVMGPYVNHNHYAGLMEMIFPIVLGLFLFYRPKIGNTSLIKGIAEIFSQEKANIHILIGTSALLIITSIFVSLSRGAMVSTCIALMFFTFFLLKRKISRGNTFFIIGVIFLAALSIGWFGWDQIFERFAQLKNTQGVVYESRIDFWKDSCNIIKDFILTGSGIGTFSHIYPLYRSIISDLFLTHAHNDYLELLSEGGIIGFSMAFSFLFTLFYKTYRVFLVRRDAMSIYLYMGSITAMIALLFHSFTDFNMHIGANGLWFFFVAGIAVASVNTGIRQHSQPTRLAVIQSSIKKIGIGLTVSIFTICVLFYNISNLLGAFYYSNIKDYTMSSHMPDQTIQKIKKISERALAFDPFQTDYTFAVANTAWFLNDVAGSEKFFIASIYHDPLNSRSLNRFATFLARKHDSENADLAFKKSMLYDRSNPEFTFQYGAWLLSKDDLEQGVFHMRKTLEMNGKFMERALTAMIVAGIDPETLEEAIPDAAGPSIEYAQFLFNTGEIDKAVNRFIDSLEMIETSKFPPSMPVAEQNKIKKVLYFKAFYFFHDYQDIKNALKTMERAEANLPADSDVKNALGDLYYQQGIFYKALIKYDDALLLNPGNAHALKMVKKINP